MKNNLQDKFEESDARTFQYHRAHKKKPNRIELYPPHENKTDRWRNTTYGPVNTKILIWLGAAPVLLFIIGGTGISSLTILINSLTLSDSLRTAYGLMTLLGLAGFIPLFIYCYRVFFQGKRKALVIPLSDNNLERSPQAYKELIRELLKMRESDYSEQTHREVYKQAEKLDSVETQKSTNTPLRAAGEFFEMLFSFMT